MIFNRNGEMKVKRLTFQLINYRQGAGDRLKLTNQSKTFDPYLLDIEGMDFAAEHVHISFELSVGVLAEAVDDAWVVGHLVLIVETNVLRFPHFVGTFLIALLLEERKLIRTDKIIVTKELLLSVGQFLHNIILNKQI